MIVVSDTTSLNYFVHIGQEHVLSLLFGRVVVPPAVVAELKRPRAPLRVREWAGKLPDWLEIQTPTSIVAYQGLGPGETEAIALALELHANIILIDERDGVAEAKRLGLNVTGTLGVIVMAAEARLLSLPEAIAALRQTTFRGPDELIEELLRQDEKHGLNDV